MYNGCYYVFVETSRENMLFIREKFLRTVSGKKESNELLSLELVNMEDLIKSYIQDRGPSSRPEFRNMMLDVGYDTIMGHLEMRRINHFTDKMNIRVNLIIPIVSLPSIVSIFIFNDNLPNIYGTIQSNGFFISDQYFFEDKEGKWFRSGLIPHSRS